MKERLDIIEERLNTTIEFIESIKSALEDMEGPIDEETQDTIDGIDILISGLKTSLSARSIRQCMYTRKDQIGLFLMLII